MAEQEGITVKKSKNFSEWYTQVVRKAELADIRYNVKGFLVHQPWSVRTMKIMYDLLEAELEKNGHEPVWFPSLIPESFLQKEKEHAEGFSAEVFWVTEGGSEGKKLEERLALRPTSETAMYSIFSLWVRSWRDLPLKTYQSCQVWRHEGKATRPFIRGREFYWIEAHDVFATEKEALNQVKEDMETTEKVIHQKYGLPFLFFQRPVHDKFSGAVDSFAADTIMPDGKVLQLPSTHLLGQNFSKPFDIKFLDKEEKQKFAWQTCYGPAIWRIFGAVVAVHGDDKGLVIPPEIAPLEVVIVPIVGNGKGKLILKKAGEVKELLLENCLSAKVDERESYTPGWKYNYWELKGVPIRLEIGPKDLAKKQVVLVRRDTGKKMAVEEKKIVKTVESLLDQIQKAVTKKADKFFSKNMHEVKSFEELNKIISGKGGLIRTNWCGSKGCAGEIKEKTSGGTIRGTLFGKKEKVFGKCVWCSKPAKEVIYVAKQY